MEQFSLSDLNGIDLVNYLSSIGITPKKRKSYHYYFLSPLAGHPENRPTFIVNRLHNRWRETTTKQSGSLSDLVVRLYDCTIGELTTILRAAIPPVQQLITGPCLDTLTKPTIDRIRPIQSVYLEQYLWQRRIILDVAHIFCKEAWYYKDEAIYHAIALPNDAGGFELFDPNRTIRIPPHGPTLIRLRGQQIAVFRDVFDTLTYISICSIPIPKLPDLLILNGPIPFEAIVSTISPYKTQQLFLPNDAFGIAFSTQAAKSLLRIQDYRNIYQGYRTLNGWNCHIGSAGTAYSGTFPY